mmetsp:Transcript_24749/g.34064  ORF Transcript_24749/g.34064 Transcript_24749/m.34064 type:complete len:315 (-) Transcript_24749:439-1383(-)
MAFHRNLNNFRIQEICNNNLDQGYHNHKASTVTTTNNNNTVLFLKHKTECTISPEVEVVSFRELPNSNRVVFSLNRGVRRVVIPKFHKLNPSILNLNLNLNITHNTTTRINLTNHQNSKAHLQVSLLVIHLINPHNNNSSNNNGNNNQPLINHHINPKNQLKGAKMICLLILQLLTNLQPKQQVQPKNLINLLFKLNHRPTQSHINPRPNQRAQLPHPINPQQYNHHTNLRANNNSKEMTFLTNPQVKQEVRFLNRINLQGNHNNNHNNNHHNNRPHNHHSAQAILHDQHRYHPHLQQRPLKLFFLTPPLLFLG